MTSTNAINIAAITSAFVSFSVIEKMVKAEIVSVQRDHVERAQRATYLKGELVADQLVFHAVKLGRKHLLVDGYTRAERVAQGLIARPKAILLITHLCKTEDDVKRIYDQLNSPKAVKTGRDRVQEGLRLAGLNGVLNSHLIVAGPLTSATRLATGMSDVREATETAGKAILFIDRLDLSREKVSCGVLGAFLAIAIHEPDLSVAEQFIRGIQKPTFEPVTDADGFIVEVRYNQAKHRANGSLSGGSMIVDMRDSTLTSYLHFRAAVKKVPKKARKPLAAEVSLGSFIDAMKLLSK